MTLTDLLLLAVLALVVIVILLLWRQRRAGELGEGGLQQLRLDNQQLERGLRDELARSGSGTRQELLGTLAQFQQTLLSQSGDVARTQNEQIDSFRVQLASLQQALGGQALAAREAQDQAMQRLTEAMREQLRELSRGNEQRLAEMRATLEQRLGAIQQDNEKKLEQMRATVDEKLQSTLEQRLGESFKQVAERLEQVYRGDRKSVV